MTKMHPEHFLIIGRSNAGKTLFIINFAEYMGYDKFTIKFKKTIDETSQSNSSINFKKCMVSDETHTTRCLQYVHLDFPVFKGSRAVDFVDTTGLSSSIHFDPDVRDGMVQTLRMLREDNIIFHIIDVPSVANEKKIAEIDMELYRFGCKRGNYAVLANKMDIMDYESGYEIIINNFKNVKIIKISALLKTGFNEVKKYASKLL